MGVFDKTIIPLALVGYEMIIAQLGATRLFGYLTISYTTRTRGIIVNDNSKVNISNLITVSQYQSTRRYPLNLKNLLPLKHPVIV